MASNNSQANTGRAGRRNGASARRNQTPRQRKRGSASGKRAQKQRAAVSRSGRTGRSGSRRRLERAGAVPRVPAIYAAAIAREKRTRECLVNYAGSLVNPADSGAVCSPHDPVLDSGKQHVWAKGSGAIGAAGFGFVVVRPSMVSDLTVGTHSTANFAGTGMANSGTGTQGILLNSPFSEFDFENDPGAGAIGLQGRVVSMGIRVRYTGTELGRSGIYVPIEHPNHSNIVDYDIADANMLASTRSLPNNADRDWRVCNWAPVSADELSYLRYPCYGFDNEGTPDKNQYPMAILLTGTPTETFEYQIFVNFEVVGNVVTNSTPSYGDQELAGDVLDAVRSLDPVAQDTLNTEGWNDTAAWAGTAFRAILAARKLINSFQGMSASRAPPRISFPDEF